MYLNILIWRVRHDSYTCSGVSPMSFKDSFQWLSSSMACSYSDCVFMLSLTIVRVPVLCDYRDGVIPNQTDSPPQYHVIASQIILC